MRMKIVQVYTTLKLSMYHLIEVLNDEQTPPPSPRCWGSEGGTCAHRCRGGASQAGRCRSRPPDSFLISSCPNNDLRVCFSAQIQTFQYWSCPWPLNLSKNPWGLAWGMKFKNYKILNQNMLKIHLKMLLTAEVNVAFHSGKPCTIWLKSERRLEAKQQNFHTRYEHTESSQWWQKRLSIHPHQDLQEEKPTWGLIMAKRTARWKRTDRWRLNTALDIPALLNLHDNIKLWIKTVTLWCKWHIQNKRSLTSVPVFPTWQYHCFPTRRRLAPPQRGWGPWSQRASFREIPPLSSSEIASQPRHSWPGV